MAARSGHPRRASGEPLPGLGPTSRAWLAAIGVHDAAQLRERDPFDVYAQLKTTQPGVSLNLIYALIGAVEGRDWRDVARRERTSILLRLEAMGLLDRAARRRTAAARRGAP